MVFPNLTETPRQLPLILIADDDRIARHILSQTLKQLSCQIIEAIDGQQCLELFLAHQPDIIILDGKMPVMDGFTCCQKIRELPEGQHVPILMITGLENEASVIQAFAAGTTDYVTKPINPIVVGRRLRQMYEVAQAQTKLRVSEEQHRTLLNSLKEVIFKTTPEGQFTFLNRAWMDVTGFSVEESLNKTLADFIHPCDRHRHANRSGQASPESGKNQSGKYQSGKYQDGDCWQYTIRLLRRDRQIAWVEVSACPVFADDGQYQGISGRLVDVTERKQRERYRQVVHITTRLLAESNHLQTTLRRWIQVICGHFDWDAGILWQLNQQQTELRAVGIWHRKKPDLAGFGDLMPTQVFQLDRVLLGRLQVQPPTNSIQLSQLTGANHSSFAWGSVISTPIRTGGQLLGLATFFSQDSQTVEPEFYRVMEGIGTQFGQFLRRKQVEAELHQQHLLLQSELQQASEYVRSLLPAAMTDRVTIQSQFVPSMQLGGDAFDYYWLDQDRLVIYLLDVTGHGIKSALLSVSVLNMLRSRVLANVQFDSPKAVLTSLNQFFQISDTRDDYFTIWYGVYNYKTGQLTYASAGHPPALLLSANGADLNGADLTVQSLKATGTPIGLFAGLHYTDKTVQIPSGSQLFLFSDGVYEIQQANGTIWGLPALTELLKSYRQQQRKELSYLFRNIQVLSNQQLLEDDFSIVELRVP
jgi:phosphoserine phosphatase RsbU/P